MVRPSMNPKLFILLLLLVSSLSLFTPKISTLKLEQKLLSLLDTNVIKTRGATLSDNDSNNIEELVSQLEKNSPIKNPIRSPLIDGVYKLLYTSSPGTNSPIQRTFTASDAVSVYQVVNINNLSESFLPNEPAVSNVVCFGDKARLRVTALASTAVNPRVIPRKGDGKIFGLNIFGISKSDPPINPLDRIDFAFQEARVEFVNTDKYLPYPVPFKLLGDEAKGWIDTTYFSGDLRICRGNKGTTFILKKADAIDPTAILAKASTESISDSSYKKAWIKSIMNSKKKSKKTKVGIILPAQLSTNDDYIDLIDTLNSSNNKLKYYTVKMNRLDWILGLIPSFFSKAYFAGTLIPSKTLAFYLKKVDEAVLNAVLENDGNIDVTLIAHSIGGWVSRAWLSEHATPELKGTVSKLITLGTPHQLPPEGNIDQTRGLLKYITERYPGAYEKNVKYYSVIGKGTEGRLELGNSFIDTIESLLGYISYSVLSGDGNTIGDGLISIDAAKLPGAELITVDNVKHSDFVPTPGKSLKLNFRWYGSPEEASKSWLTILK